MADRYTPNEAAEFVLRAAEIARACQQKGRNEDFVSWVLSIADWVQNDRQYSHIVALHVAARAICQHCGGNLPVHFHQDEDPEFDCVWVHPPATFQDKEFSGGVCAAGSIQDLIREFEAKTLEERSDIPNLAARMTVPDLAPQDQTICPKCCNNTRFNEEAHAAILWSCGVCGHLQIDPDYVAPAPAAVPEPEEGDDLDPVDPDFLVRSDPGGGDGLPVGDDDSGGTVGK